MNKFSWSFDEDAEIWYASGESVKDCLAQAEADNAVEGNKYQVVYIGENVQIAVHVDVEAMLDTLEDNLYDLAGDAADGWSAYELKKQDELNELAALIDPIVMDWLKKYREEPDFYTIENIKQYPLTNSTRDKQEALR